MYLFCCVFVFVFRVVELSSFSMQSIYVDDDDIFDTTLTVEITCHSAMSLLYQYDGTEYTVNDCTTTTTISGLADGVNAALDTILVTGGGTSSNMLYFEASDSGRTGLAPKSRSASMYVMGEDDPVASVGAFSVYEGSTTTEQMTCACMRVGTCGEARTVTFRINSSPSKGTVSLIQDGNDWDVQYTPTTGAGIGSDAFTISCEEVHNGITRISSTADVEVTILNVNDPPEIQSFRIEVNEDEETRIEGRLNKHKETNPPSGGSISYDPDFEIPEGDTLSYEIYNTTGTTGTVSIEAGDDYDVLIYTTEENNENDDSFRIRVRDAAGAYSSDVVVEVRVTPVNGKLSMTM